MGSYDNVCVFEKLDLLLDRKIRRFEYEEIVLF